jgi:hypothetical protein
MNAPEKPPGDVRWDETCGYWIRPIGSMPVTIHYPSGTTRDTWINLADWLALPKEKPE